MNYKEINGSLLISVLKVEGDGSAVCFCTDSETGCNKLEDFTKEELNNLKCSKYFEVVE